MPPVQPGAGFAFGFVFSLALLARFLVSLHPYSGAGVAPKYGDYEAQRHWMEVTTNLPATEWYVQTEDNDLGYWGLDYPPLSGYQSWLFGKIIQFFDPDAVALHTSQGYETRFSKLLLRLSVIASDVLVFFPATWLCLRAFGSNKQLHEKCWWLLVVLLQPAALLIDHGHFQYNNISQGLTVAAAGAIALGHECWGSCLFSLALNHKQMSMYHAPAFFAHLLGKCLQRPKPQDKVLAIVKLGAVVICTFALCWAPFLATPGGATSVLQRLVPVKRGLYEDYVANFWCVTSPAFKWRQLYSQQALVRMCAGSSLLAALPSMVQQMRQPTPSGLLRSMANSALAFFLFSYQVHEKSIMLALLPVSLLAFEEPALAAWLPAWGTLGMFPLLRKDGLGVAYISCLLLWLGIAPPPHYEVMVSSPADADSSKAQQQTAGRHLDGFRRRGITDSGCRRAWHCSQILCVLVAACVHIAQCCLQPPSRYPFLYDAAYVSLAFVQICGAMLYANCRQWSAALQQHEALSVKQL